MPSDVEAVKSLLTVAQRVSQVQCHHVLQNVNYLAVLLKILGSQLGARALLYPWLLALVGFRSHCLFLSPNSCFCFLKG